MNAWMHEERRAEVRRQRSVKWNDGISRKAGQEMECWNSGKMESPASDCNQILCGACPASNITISICGGFEMTVLEV